MNDDTQLLVLFGAVFEAAGFNSVNRNTVRQTTNCRKVSVKWFGGMFYREEKVLIKMWEVLLTYLNLGWCNCTMYSAVLVVDKHACNTLWYLRM